MKHTVYDRRHRGQEICKGWEGSAHYKTPEEVEPLDLMASNGTLKDFCLGSIIKYAGRFNEKQNILDLVKIADYAQILIGDQIFKEDEKANVRKAECNDHPTGSADHSTGYWASPVTPGKTDTCLSDTVSAIQSKFGLGVPGKIETQSSNTRPVSLDKHSYSGVPGEC